MAELAQGIQTESIHVCTFSNTLITICHYVPRSTALQALCALLTMPHHLSHISILYLSSSAWEVLRCAMLASIKVSAYT